MIFNIIVGNIDDHVRNHIVLMKEPGVLELSPPFDLCLKLMPRFGRKALALAHKVELAPYLCSYPV